MNVKTTVIKGLGELDFVEVILPNRNIMLTLHAGAAPNVKLQKTSFC